MDIRFWIEVGLSIVLVIFIINMYLVKITIEQLMLTQKAWEPCKAQEKSKPKKTRDTKRAKATKMAAKLKEEL